MNRSAAGTFRVNEVQQQIAKHTEGPVLVIAGPGSGKTKTLVDRIVNLVKKGVENTIDTVGKLARFGMKETDEEIIRLMLED